MNPDQANEARKPVTRFERIADTILAIAWIALFGASFSSFVDLEGLAFALFCVLLAPLMLAHAVFQWRNQSSWAGQVLALSVAGAFVFIAALVVQLVATFLAPPPLSAAIAIPVIVLQWLGVALLAIGNLLLIIRLINALLARMRPRRQTSPSSLLCICRPMVYPVVVSP
jgi:hypothetical protein